jgi:hypothetical protein
MSKRPEQEALQVSLLLCALCAPPLACPRSHAPQQHEALVRSRSMLPSNTKPLCAPALCSPATRSPCALPLYAPQQHEALWCDHSHAPASNTKPFGVIILMLPPATRSPCARPCARVQDTSVCAPALMPRSHAPATSLLLRTFVFGTHLLLRERASHNKTKIASVS